MLPPPIAIALTLCEKVIVEEGSRNVTLVSTFNQIVVREVPSAPQRFDVFALLTDGLGDATIDMVITRLETDEEICTRRMLLRFPNRLIEVNVFFRVAECSFPAPGKYQATLLVDGEWVAHRRFQVRLKEA